MLVNAFKRYCNATFALLVNAFKRYCNATNVGDGRGTFFFDTISLKIIILYIIIYE